jgi:hypothetical protein
METPWCKRRKYRLGCLYRAQDLRYLSGTQGTAQCRVEIPVLSQGASFGVQKLRL